MYQHNIKRREKTTNHVIGSHMTPLLVAVWYLFSLSPPFSLSQPYVASPHNPLVLDGHSLLTTMLYAKCVATF